MEKKPLNLILLGDPASGKATQAARLVRKYHFYDFDMGREVKKPAVRARYDYAGITAHGNLTPTAIVREILRRTIRTVPQRRGILFDGHPKMIGEAKLVAKWLKQYKRSDPFVLYLSIPTAEKLRRAKKRKRDDDSTRALKNRRRYYKDQVARVVAFFKKKYAFRKISGMGSRAEVWTRIAAAIDYYAS